MYGLVVVNFLVFLVFLVLLYRLQQRDYSLSTRVFASLAIGSILGVIAQIIYGANSEILRASISYISIFGSGYVQLLKMLIYPLVLIFILAAITKLKDISSLGKIASLSIGTLLLTTAISALIGALVIAIPGLSAEGLLDVEPSTEAMDKLVKRVSIADDIGLTQWILSFIPSNPFSDLTGARPSSVIATAVFSILLGIAAIKLRLTNEEAGERIASGIDLFQTWIAQLIKIVMQLTPYGVLALITKVIATTSWLSLFDLISFIAWSYVGLFLIGVVHALLIWLVKLSPYKFFTKSWPALIFAFTSRSSAAAVPLSVEIQTTKLGVPNSIASFVASFGTTIGQNGCAGLYPAMLAAMLAPVMGIDPLDPIWLLTLVLVTTLSSIGIAGVGGGATFAALLVLPMMGLPIELIAILVAIEPLIDMGRTAINVSGAMVAGLVTSQVMRQTDVAKFNAKLD